MADGKTAGILDFLFRMGWVGGRVGSVTGVEGRWEKEIEGEVAMWFPEGEGETRGEGEIRGVPEGVPTTKLSIK